MLTVETLMEQAEFLLQQHQAAHVACSKDFGSLLEYLQTKMHEEGDEEAAGILMTVYEALKKQGDDLDKNMLEDIEFLQDQIKAFTEVIAIKDPIRKEELTKLLLEDAGEIQATEDFKKEVLFEAEENRKGLADMIADIRQAIEEGGAAELESLFQAMEDEDEDSENDCCSAGCEQDPTDLENSSCGCGDEEDDEEFDEDDESEETENQTINIFEHLDTAPTPAKSVQA